MKKNIVNLRSVEFHQENHNVWRLKTATLLIIREDSRLVYSILIEGKMTEKVICVVFIFLGAFFCRPLLNFFSLTLLIKAGHSMFRKRSLFFVLMIIWKQSKIIMGKINAIFMTCRHGVSVGNVYLSFCVLIGEIIIWIKKLSLFNAMRYLHYFLGLGLIFERYLLQMCLLLRSKKLAEVPLWNLYLYILLVIQGSLELCHKLYLL